MKRITYLFILKASIMTYTTAQKNDHLKLQAHLNSIAAKDKASGNLFTIVTDLDHWIGYDVHSVAQFEHYEAESAYIEHYKDINNIKPRWIDFSKLSTEKIYEELNTLLGIDNPSDIERANALKEKNAYKPNLAFSGLSDLLG